MKSITREADEVWEAARNALYDRSSSGIWVDVYNLVWAAIYYPVDRGVDRSINDFLNERNWKW